MRYFCPTCQAVTYHWHLHDTVDGVAETHQTGSERFQCRPCGHTTFAHDERAAGFPFVLDGKAQRTIAA